MPEKNDKKAEIISILREHDAEQKDRQADGGAPTKRNGRKRKSPEFSIVGNGNIQVGRDIHLNFVQPPSATLKIKVEAHPGGEHIDDRQDAWRKRYYAFIKANSKHEPEVLAAYLQRIFKATSLTELDNDELARVYRYVAGRRSAGRSKL